MDSIERISHASRIRSTTMIISRSAQRAKSGILVPSTGGRLLKNTCFARFFIFSLDTQHTLVNRHEEGICIYLQTKSFRVKSAC